ncbi:MAG: hypothetical protein U0228_08855 [Myxococcaceae bacterium]
MKSRSHILALVLTALVPGCQCFVPVDDVPDGGQLDAGHDAGTDAGPPLECLDLDDCSPDASVRCWGGSTPRRSCFDNHCVLDCSGARTCTTSAGTCLTCDGGLNTCAPGCSGFQNGDVGRLYRDCGSGPTLIGGFSTRYAQGATCNFVLSTDAGVTITLDAHGGDETSVAQVSTEPGINCSVQSLATALNRVHVGCASCLYLLEWP